MARITHSIVSSPVKPSRNQISNVWQKSINYITEDLTVPQFAGLVVNGHSWRAGIYKCEGERFAKANAATAQVVGLDFDMCEYSLFEVCKYADEIGLPVNVAYYTYSQSPEKVFKNYPNDLSTYKYIKVQRSNGQNLNSFSINPAYKDKNNFRIVWLLEKEVAQTKYEKIVEQLIKGNFKQFNADTAPCDVSRLWFGGATEAYIFNEKPISLATIAWQEVIAEAEKAAKTGKSKKSYINKKGILIEEIKDLPIPDKVTVQTGWIEKLRGRCPLLDMWIKQEYFPYKARLKLFTNLKYLTYADKSKSIIQDIISYYNPDAEAWIGHSINEEQIYLAFKDNGLIPQEIVIGRGKEPITVIDFFKDNLNLPTFPQVKKCSLEELDAWMNENIPALLKEQGVHYINSQTASGKTEQIIKYIETLDLSETKVIYCVPTHDDAIEFEKRIERVFTVQCNRCPKIDLPAKDEMLLQLGLMKETSFPERNIFISKLMKDTCGLFIITHSLLVNLPDIEADLIIVDENIEDCLIRNSKMSIQQLASIRPYIPKDSRMFLDNLIDRIQDEKRGTEISLSLIFEKVALPFRDRIEDYLATADASLIPSGFFNCERHPGKISTMNGQPCLRITRKSPVIENAIEKGIPVKLFTATPMNSRLKNYYGLDIDVVEAPLAKNRGNVYQYRGCTGAKGVDNDKLPEIDKYIRKKLTQEQINDSYLISFKTSISYWVEHGYKVAETDDNVIHFRNNAGLDIFKGHNMIVAGKWDYPDEYYYDILDDLNIEGELLRQNIVVDMNGVRQNLYLYNIEAIRNEQIQNINYAIEQAVGRARSLREDANVYVFANFVIRDADEVFD